MSNKQRDLLNMSITLTPKVKKKKPTLDIELDEFGEIEFNKMGTSKKALTSADDIFGKIS